MEYFFCQTPDEVRGPVSEEVLKNLFFQGRIGHASPVCLSGETSWRTLGDVFPDLEFFKGCPKCFEKLTVRDETCTHCQFSVQDYEDNLERVRRREAIQEPVSKEVLDAWIRDNEAFANTGCFLLLAIGVFALLCLIPLLGPLLAVLWAIVALIQFITPVWLKMWWYKTISRKSYEQALARAREALYSPLLGPCPNCYSDITEKSQFVSDDCTCPHCGGRLFLQDGYVYFIPHPHALLSKRYEDLMTPENRD